MLLLQGLELWAFGSPAVYMSTAKLRLLGGSVTTRIFLI
jgi:hypothetical protein